MKCMYYEWKKYYSVSAAEAEKEQQKPYLSAV